MMKRLSVVVAVLFLLVLNAGFSSAITGAMGNARMVLYPEVNGWTNTVIEKSILVKNVNNERINITLQMNEGAEKFIELVDKSFILEPNTEKEAKFIVKVRKEGTYDAKINIFFSSVDEEKAGVALSSEIIVIAKKDQGYDDSKNQTDENGSITGNIIGKVGDGIKNVSSVTWIAIGSTFILLVILVFLITVLSKKGEKRRKN
jgi:hypothetical protein